MNTFAPLTSRLRFIQREKKTLSYSKTFLCSTLFVLVSSFCIGGVNSVGPLNDNCENAIDLVFGETSIHSLCGASLAEIQSIDLELEIYDIWFKVTMNESQFVSLTSSNLNNEAYGMSIFSGNECGNFESENYGGPMQIDISFNFYDNFEWVDGSVFYSQIWSTFESCADIEMSLESHVLGCTEYCNMNYNPQATMDDGSCLYSFDSGMFCNGAETLFYNSTFPHVRAINAGLAFPCFMPNSPNAQSGPVNGGVYLDFEGNGLETTINTCDNYGVTEFHVYKQIGDCEEEVDYIGRSVPSDEECPQASTNPQDFSFLSEEGATYLIYLSTWDDDGLEHTDYSAEASISISSEQPVDFNNDGETNGTDLLIFIAFFGCSGDDCLGDINNDGVVNASDMMLCLTDFNG